MYLCLTLYSIHFAVCLLQYFVSYSIKKLLVRFKIYSYNLLSLKRELLLYLSSRLTFCFEAFRAIIEFFVE